MNIPQTVYKRVLFLHPFYAGSTTSEAILHPGLGYISEFLSTHGIETTVVDMALGYSLEGLLARIDAFKPQLIGMTMMSMQYGNTYKVLSHVKKNFSHVPLAVGGPHISMMGERALEDCPSIDLGIVQEGELTMLEICQGKPIKEIEGLIYRDNGIPKYTGDRTPIYELDELPFPSYESFELEKYPSGIPLVSSRGCPYACTFCVVHRVSGKKFRGRSAKNLVDEIEYWYRRGIRFFVFRDDNFTLVEDRVYQVCDEIEARGLRDITLHLANGVRADRINRRLLSRMKEVGFNYIALGVEAGNNRILKQIKKGETLEQIETTIRDACEEGYDVRLFFLIGSPGERWSDIEDTARLALKYPIAGANFYNIIPLPGTQLYEWVESNGYLRFEPEDYLNMASPHWINEPLFSTPELSVKERKRAFDYLNNQVSRAIGRHYLRARFGLLGALYGWLRYSEAFLWFLNRYKKSLWMIHLSRLRRWIFELLYRESNKDKARRLSALDIPNELMKSEKRHFDTVAKNFDDNLRYRTLAGRCRIERRVEFFLNGTSPNSSVLELGCGTGEYTRGIAGKARRLSALDISIEMIKQGREKCKGLKDVGFIVGDASTIPFKDGYFDAVVGNSVLHHMPRLMDVLSEIKRVLKPGGYIAFSEPNMLNPQIAILKNVGFVKRFAGDSPDETAFFRWQLKRTLEDVGFKGVEVKPIEFLHPFTPAPLVSITDKIGKVIESLPLVKEISGSLFIYGKRL